MKVRSDCLVAAASAGLYAASMFLPLAPPFMSQVAENNGSPRVVVLSQPGFVAFRESWKMLNYWEPTDADWWVLGAPWLANPAIWLGVVFLAAGSWRLAMVTGGSGLVLALLVISQYSQVGADVGYWAWAGSAAILFCGGLVHMVAYRSPRNLPA
jgi:hypothetical protein